MGVCNVVSLVLLVFIFTADCKADEYFSISCDDVTARVGEEFSLTCSVSYQDNTCCMMKYKFMNKDKNTEIYKEEFQRNPCLQFPSITFPHTAHEVMTTTFKFFLQTTCEVKTAEFSVNITDAGKEETGTKTKILEVKEETAVQTDKSALAVIISVLSCFTIIVMAIIIKRKRNISNTSASQREYDKGVCVCENNISKHTDIETV